MVLPFIPLTIVSDANAMPPTTGCKSTHTNSNHFSWIVFEFLWSFFLLSDCNVCHRSLLCHEGKLVLLSNVKALSIWETLLLVLVVTCQDVCTLVTRMTPSTLLSAKNLLVHVSKFVRLFVRCLKYPLIETNIGT